MHRLGKIWLNVATKNDLKEEKPTDAQPLPSQAKAPENNGLEISIGRINVNKVAYEPVPQKKDLTGLGTLAISTPIKVNTSKHSNANQSIVQQDESPLGLQEDI